MGYVNCMKLLIPILGFTAFSLQTSVVLGEQQTPATAVEKTVEKVAEKAEQAKQVVEPVVKEVKEVGKADQAVKKVVEENTVAEKKKAVAEEATNVGEAEKTAAEKKAEERALKRAERKAKRAEKAKLAEEAESAEKTKKTDADTDKKAKVKKPKAKLQAPEGTPEVKTLEIGAAAPDFKLIGVDDKEYTLESFKDHSHLVMVFTCNHCPDARATWGRLNTFAAEYEKKGVKVVAISSNSPAALQPWENGFSVFGDTFEEMKQVSKIRKFNFPYLYDGDKQEMALAYGAMATPHCFVFDADRKLVYHGQFDNGRRDPGPAEKNTLKDNVDTLLAGGTIAEPVMRTYGCSTKWAWKKSLVANQNKAWAALKTTVEVIDAEGVKKLAANDTKNIRVINVWSTTCGPCIAEFPMLIDTYRRYQRRPFDMITLSVDPKEDADAVVEFLNDEHVPVSPRTEKSMKAEGRTAMNFHYQGKDLDPFADALDKAWAGPMPYTLVIAPGGEILYRHPGLIDPVKLRQEIVKGLESL